MSCKRCTGEIIFGKIFTEFLYHISGLICSLKMYFLNGNEEMTTLSLILFTSELVKVMF